MTWKIGIISIQKLKHPHPPQNEWYCSWTLLRVSGGLNVVAADELAGSLGEVPCLRDPETFGFTPGLEIFDDLPQIP